MAKKVVKKKKIRIVPFLVFILIVVSIGFSIKFFLDRPIINIVITGNNYLNDDYIISNAEIGDYPSFLLTSSMDIEKKLKESPYIKDVNVKKKFYRVLKIEVEENKPLIYDQYTKSLVFSNHKSINVEEEIDYFRVPRLINYVPKDKYNTFIDSMNLVNNDIMSKISDIEYKPNDIDKERFLLYMDDGNSVYLTLTKIDKINYYNKVLAQLEGHKGILYLDNGNHFKIMG